MINENQLLPYSASDIPKGPYLVVAPHPDDESIGMGGTIALATRSGIDVYLVIVTDGAKGGDPDIRKEEAGRAAQILGIKEVIHLNVPDREVFQHPFAEDVLGDIFKQVQPATVFLPSFQEIHPDHRAATHNFLSFLGTVADPLELWFYEINRHGEINRLIDIASVLDQKEEAIECYGSQLSLLDYKVHALCMNTTRSITLGGSSYYAEGFWVYPYGDSKTPENDYFNLIDQYRISVNMGLREKEELKGQLKALKDRVAAQTAKIVKVTSLAREMADYLNDLVDENRQFKQEANPSVTNPKAGMLPCVAMGLKEWLRKKRESLARRILGQTKIQKDRFSSAPLDLEEYPVYRLTFMNDGWESWRSFQHVHHDDLRDIQVKANRPVPLYSNQRVHFQIRSRAPGISQIELFMATYDRINPGTLVLKVYEDSDMKRGLRSALVGAATVLDNSFVSFCFDPIPVSENRTFFVSLELEGGVQDRCLGVWTSTEFPPLKYEAYQVWIKEKEQPFIEPIDNMEENIDGLSWRPKITVIGRNPKKKAEQHHKNKKDGTIKA